MLLGLGRIPPLSLENKEVMEKDGGLMNKRKIEEDQWKILIGYFTMY